MFIIWTFPSVPISNHTTSINGFSKYNIADDLDVQPVDPQRILAVAQRHIVQPAVAMDETLCAAPDRLLDHWQFGAAEVFPDQRVGGGLTGEEELAAGVEHGLAERLSGEQVITPR